MRPDESCRVVVGSGDHPGKPRKNTRELERNFQNDVLEGKSVVHHFWNSVSQRRKAIEELKAKNNQTCR